MFMRTPQPQTKTLLVSVHRGIMVFFLGLSTWVMVSVITRGAISPGRRLCFVPSATILVTSAKVVARDPKKGHFGVGAGGKTNSPVPTCMADQEWNFHWHFIWDTSYVNANTFSLHKHTGFLKFSPWGAFLNTETGLNQITPLCCPHQL